MKDRLVWLLKHFELRAEVFHVGRVRSDIAHDAAEGVGHLHLLRSGCVRIQSPGEPPQQAEGPCLIFYLNPTTHSLTPLSRSADLVCANVSFGIGHGNPLRQALPQLVVLALADSPMLSQTLELLFKEADEDHCGRQAVLDRLSEIVLIQLLRELMDQGLMEIGLLAGLADPKLARAINAMHADPAGAWTLNSLAHEAGMSRARFAVNFRTTVGMTPGEYLSEWRLGLAQSLLREGKPVNLIADLVGYANASALSRAFSASQGLAPTAWLKQQADAGMETSAQ